MKFNPGLALGTSIGGDQRNKVERIRILLADRNELFRDGVGHALSREKDIDVVGESHDAEGAFSVVKSQMPSVVILDIGLCQPDAFELISKMRRYCPAVSIIAVTGDEDDEELYAAVRAGAAAYLCREVRAADLVAIIRKVAGGEYPINDSLTNKPRVATRILEQFQNLSLAMGKEAEGLIIPLSPREIEILRLVAHGNSNKQVASSLNLKEQTVKNYVTNILRKLAANDRTHAVFIALKRGWIDLK